MARCFSIKQCEEMIKKIKETQQKYPEGFMEQPYDYWCPMCDFFNHKDYCHCDNDS